MPKNKKSKKSKKLKNPKLCLLDKITYWVLLALLISLIGGSVVLFSIIPHWIGEASGAIATESNDPAILWILVPLFPLAFVMLIPWMICLDARRPIFGSREGVLPRVRRKMRKPKKTILLFVLAAGIWLGSWVPAIGSLWCRVDITETGIAEYGMFGRVREDHAIADATAIKARIYFGSSGTGVGNWKMVYSICLADGEEYSFHITPRIALEIHHLFEDLPRTVEGAENFEKLCREYDCSEEERTALAELFRIRE